MMLKFTSRSVRSLIASVGVAVVVAGAQVTPALADDVSPEGSAAVAELQARSAAIPQQPQADFSSDAPLTARIASARPGIDDRVGWTRTCERGYGVEQWNIQPIDNCAGTVKWYYNGEFAKSLNILRWQASQPPRTTIDLDKWCADSPFWCAGVWAFVGMGFTVVYGAITG